jgi:mitochondrial fission protein ELM1
MKSLIQAVVAIAAVAALAAPVASFAQSNAPVTRAQVRAELNQLAKAGYHVGDGDNAHYPDAIQAAEARVAAQDSATTGYGGSANGTSASGRPGVSAADWNAMYTR